MRHPNPSAVLLVMSISGCEPGFPDGHTSWPVVLKLVKEGKVAAIMIPHRGSCVVELRSGKTLRVDLPILDEGGRKVEPDEIRKLSPADKQPLILME